MRAIHSIIIIAIVGILGALAGVAWQQLQTSDEASASKPATSLETLTVMPDFHYPDIEGRNRQGAEWTNKVVVLNFWATWCPPCRAEMPMFVEMQKKYDGVVQFVGIAIDDPAPVMEFAQELGVNYPILLGDIKAIALSKKLGNRFSGLPFTVIAKPGGKIETAFSGEVKRAQLDALLEQLTQAGT